MDDIIIPIHKMVGKNPEIDVLPDETLEDKLRSDAYVENQTIKEIYVQIEFSDKSKSDNFFTNINDAKEFLATYE